MPARFASTIIFTAVFLYGLYSDRTAAGHIIFAIIVVATLAGTREYYKLAKRKKIRPSPWPGYLTALAFLVDAYFFKFDNFVYIFILCFWLLLITQVFFKRLDRSIANTSTTLFGAIYLGMPLAIVLDLFGHSDKWGFAYPHAGGNLVIFLFACSWATDIGGYCFGKPFGKHKMSPTLSPNKSFEGLAGGAVLAILFGALLKRFWPGMDEMFNWAEMLCLPVLFTIVGTVGDLAESAFKRDANIKDSGTTYTGHGGMLDILDSLLLCAPVFYLYLKLTR